MRCFGNLQNKSLRGFYQGGGIMNIRPRVIVTLCLLSMFIIVSGCTGVIVRSHGHERPRHSPPPPHAPAHGYRHRTLHGIDTEYDARLGVYVVMGHPGHYFYNNRYYRFRDGYWEISGDFRRGWKRGSAQPLPNPVRARHREVRPPSPPQRRDRDRENTVRDVPRRGRR